MKKEFLKASVGVALILLYILALAPDSAQAQAKAEYKWRMGSAWTQKERNESLALFADLIQVYSKGKIEVKFQHSGLLGTHDELFHAVREGSVQIGVYAPYVNLVPGGMLNWMPWTVGSYDEAAIAYTGPDGMLFKIMDKAWDEIGFKLLWNPPMGPYGLGNKVRPLKNPDNLEKLKLRVSASLGFVRTLENMGKGTGMKLETIPWADLYNALQTGVVDGCWSLWGSLVEERHFEVLKYYTVLDFAWDSCNVAINKKLWESLPKDMKDAIIKAGKVAEERDFEAHRRADLEYRKKLVASGLQLYFPTPEERETWRQKANMPAVWKELCEPWLEKHFPGQNMGPKMQDELAKVKKEAGR